MTAVNVCAQAYFRRGGGGRRFACVKTKTDVLVSSPYLDPFKIAVPFRGQNSLTLGSLPTKRDCSPQRVKLIDGGSSWFCLIVNTAVVFEC